MNFKQENVSPERREQNQLSGRCFQCRAEKSFSYPIVMAIKEGLDNNHQPCHLSSG